MIVLWDLGNVVVEWEPEKILRNMQYPERETAMVREQLLTHQDWLDLDRGVTTEDEVTSRLLSRTPLTKAQIHRCFEVIRHSLIDIDPTVALLREVHRSGIPMYVLSNMSLVNAAYLRQREYFKLFDGVIISAEEKLIKPEAALFQRTIDRFRLPAAETLFVDDSLPNIEMARELGLQTHHFLRTDHCYRTIRNKLGLSG